MFRPRKLLSILVVEDDLDILRKIVVHISRQFGRSVQILQAKTLEEGKDIVRQGLFDIAIIDLLLPDGHGEDLIALIRERFFYLPIIVQTTERDTAYQAKVHNQYENLIYLEKAVLFDELADRLNNARNRYEKNASWRLSIVSSKKIESIDINEVCYISKVPESSHLHIELYDFNEGDYKFTTIKEMTLIEFINTYNAAGYFLRCHNSYIVNRKMIKSFSRVDNQITMLMPRKGGSEVMIGVSEKYKKQVREAMRGLY